MGGLSSRTDTELLLGDGAAFAAFYRRYEDAVLGFHLRRCRSAEVAADLTAETFARALGSRGRFDATLGAPAPWLMGIASNVLLRSLERRRVDDAVRRRLGMEPVLLDDRRIRAIEELAGRPAVDALDALPDDQASAVRGRVVDELSYSELAAALECSESVVRQRVSRGLRALRSILEDSR